MRLAATWWSWVAVLAPFMIVCGFLGVTIRRDPRVWTHRLRVLAYVFTAMFVVSFGPLLQSTTWLTLNWGLVLAWHSVEHALTEDCLCIISAGFEFGLLPGALLGISGFGLAPFTRRIARAAVVTFTAFVVSDTVGALTLTTGVQPGTEIMFGFLANVVGAIIAAAVVISINDSAFRIFDRARGAMGPSRSRLMELLRASVVVVFLGLFTLATIYFIFIHQLPSRIDISADEWSKLSFRSAPRQIADPDLQDPVSIPIVARSVLAPSTFSTLSLRVHRRAEAGNRDESGRGAMDVSISTSGGNSSPNETRRVFAKSVPVGEITIKGEDLRPLIWLSEGERSEMTVYAPRNSHIRMSKETEDVARFDLPGDDGAPRLLVQGALTLSMIVKASFSLIPNVPSDVSRRSGGLWEINIPGEEAAIKIPAEVTPCCKGPRIRIAVVLPYESKLELDGGRALVFGDAALGDPFRSGLHVTDTSLSGGGGTAVIGEVSRRLTKEDMLLLAGERLGIRARGAQGVKIAGEARLVTVNGDVLSKSVWSSIPVQIQAVIVAAALTILGKAIWSAGGRHFYQWYRRRR
jgi:hypothetical protein